MTRSDTGAERPPDRVLLTGYPAFTAVRMAREILAREPECKLYLLARKKFLKDARAFVDALSDGQGDQVEIVCGDICNMDLGLSGEEYSRLTQDVTCVHHVAGIYYMGVDRATAHRVNVEGTRGVLEFAGDAPRLRRMVHWSTISVSGKRKGVILESELDEGQSFHNFYEETKFEAEKLARVAQAQLPITIVRPGLIVGDSRTGEIDKFDGPYYLVVLLATGSPKARVSLPGRGTAPLHLVPIDFVVRASYQLAIDDAAAGGTFHLTDPNPLSTRRVFEIIAELSQTRLRRGFLPTGLRRSLFRAPGFERIARAPLSFLEALDQHSIYNCKETVHALRGTGIECPTFDEYAENLVRFVRESHQDEKSDVEDEVFDPFD